MKPSRKVQKKLERRLNGHAQLLASLSAKHSTTPPTAFKKPGSRNRGKG